jgi:hypothetical protein
MASSRQIEANRRNALKSTGPRTQNGKMNSRQNAVRHGLTAETVVVPIEDVEDYKSFEASIVLDYDAQSAVERELVLRLASLLWRLRRATAIETRLFELVSEGPHESEPARNEGASLEIFGPSRNQMVPRCFLRVVRLEDGAFDRLSRYEAVLWRQVGQTLFTLECLERRKPQERSGRIRWRIGPQTPEAETFQSADGQERIVRLECRTLWSFAATGPWRVLGLEELRFPWRSLGADARAGWQAEGPSRARLRV